MVDDLIDFVGRASDWKLAMIVLALALAESLVITDLMAPGEVGLVVAGAAAARNGTDLVLVAGAASVGAVAGDLLGFLLGRRFGTDFVERHRWLRSLRRSLRRARRYFERRGPAVVAVARWIGALRAVVPVVAGAARLPAARFLLADVPSAIAWCFTMASIGFVWGDDIAGFVDRIGIGVSVAVIAAIVLFVIVQRRRRRDGHRGEHSVDDSGRTAAVCRPAERSGLG